MTEDEHRRALDKVSDSLQFLTVEMTTLSVRFEQMERLDRSIQDAHKRLQPVESSVGQLHRIETGLTDMQARLAVLEAERQQLTGAAWASKGIIAVVAAAVGGLATWLIKLFTALSDHP